MDTDGDVRLVNRSSVKLPHWIPKPSGRARSQGSYEKSRVGANLTSRGKMFQSAGATAEKAPPLVPSKALQYCLVEII